MGDHSHIEVAATAQVPRRAEGYESPWDNGVQISIDGVIVMCIGVDVDKPPSVRLCRIGHTYPAASLRALKSLPAVGDGEFEVGARWAEKLCW